MGKILNRKLSTLNSQLSTPRGFTLIELIIVIAVLGVLASAVLVGLDPLDKIAQANDSSIQSNIRQIQAAEEIYAVNNDGTYATSQTILSLAKELKNTIAAPGGKTYTLGVASNNTVMSIYHTLRSKKYVIGGTFGGVIVPANSSIWQWCSSTGIAGATTTPGGC